MAKCPTGDARSLIAPCSAPFALLSLSCSRHCCQHQRHRQSRATSRVTPCSSAVASRLIPATLPSVPCVHSYTNWIGRSLFLHNLTVYFIQCARTSYARHRLSWIWDLTSTKRLATVQENFNKYIVEIFINNSLAVRRSKIVTRSSEFKTSS